MPRKTSPRAIKKLQKTASEKAVPASTDLFIAEDKNILEVILSYAIELGSGELHFEWQEGQLRLRWRLGGKLAEPFRFDSGQAAAVRAQISAKFDICPNSKLPFEERTITYSHDACRYFLSLSVISIANGDRFFLRMTKSEKYGLQRLDLDGLQKQAADDLFRSEGGIFIIGAVRTPDRQKILKALAGQYCAQSSKAVLISEQPIYDWSSGDIMAVRPEIGFSRSVAIRAATQGGYDCVLIDLVSRPEEMELLIALAEAGKKILIGVPWFVGSKNFHYLWQLTEDKNTLAALCRGMVTECLLPKLCQRCHQSHKLKAQGRLAIEQVFAQVPDHLRKKLKIADVVNGHFSGAKGCVFCQKTGYSGQQPVYSVAKFKKSSKAASKNFNFNELIAKQNFISLPQIAIIKASHGYVDLIDALSFFA